MRTKADLGRVVQSQLLWSLWRRFTVQKVTDDFGQGAERTQQTKHGSRAADFDQVDLHQSIPGRCDVGLYDGRHRI